MAIVYHMATLTPGKLELLTDWLDRQPWGGSGEVGVAGAYRFDDPDGEVGVEGHLLRRGEQVLHVPVTYRGAPLDDPAAVLVGRTEHSLLGPRWVYDATTDPVGRDCLARATRGEQSAAVYELWEGETVVGQREPTAVLTSETDESGGTDGTGGPAEGDRGGAVIDLTDGSRLRVARVLGVDDPVGTPRLRVAWDGGTATLAAIAPA